jgi:transposase
MGKNPDLSESQRAEIWEAYKTDGKSTRVISAELSISKSAVGNKIKRLKEHPGQYKSAREKKRPQKEVLSKRDKVKLREAANKNQSKSYGWLKRQVGLDCSDKTVSRALKKFGYNKDKADE